MTEPQTFAQVLRTHRRAIEDSQEHVAELANARQATVSRWEQGTLFPDDSHDLRKLARYLDMPVADLRALIERSELEAERARLARKLATVDQRLHAFRVK